MTFIIRGLKSAHEKTCLSAYMVNKHTGVATATVSKYTESDQVKTDMLYPSVIKLIKYYGLDWRDPKVVEFVSEEEIEGNTKTPLVA